MPGRDDGAQAILGDYNADDYERVTDILDVWFDSGSTHAFVLESGRWPDLKATLAARRHLSRRQRPASRLVPVELLESCATRGRAPYKAVLTHGFTMDAKGMKMSKSLGNTIDPIKVMETYGADIIRLWALSVDFTEDHRIGDEILKGVADQYRKLRNTFRYLLGALDGFARRSGCRCGRNARAGALCAGAAGAAGCDAENGCRDLRFQHLRPRADRFLQRGPVGVLLRYPQGQPLLRRGDRSEAMAYRTVLDTLFHALVRYAAPVLVFTAEEVWGTRYPGWRAACICWNGRWCLPNDGLDMVPSPRDQLASNARQVNEAIEPLRREKISRLEPRGEIKPCDERRLLESISPNCSSPRGRSL
jgi:isoleucyl-tRNA synthetase